MSRDMYCASCNKYLGFIEKGRVRKKTAHLCGTCEAARRLMKSASENTQRPYSDVLKDIFK
jgi:RNase P subunit RPR2